MLACWPLSNGAAGGGGGDAIGAAVLPPIPGGLDSGLVGCGNPGEMTLPPGLTIGDCPGGQRVNIA